MIFKKILKYFFKILKALLWLLSSLFTQDYILECMSGGCYDELENQKCISYNIIEVKFTQSVCQSVTL